MYAFLFWTGFLGFLGMAGMGFLHIGHDVQSAHHGGTGDALGHPGGIQHGGRISQGHARGGQRASVAKSARGSRFRSWWAISPFDIFAFFFGAGVVGELLTQKGIAPNLTIAAAVAGALVFDLGIAKPVLNTLLRFESRRSEGLEGSVAQRVEAISRFDAQGRGLVQLALDGQLVQVLAHLDPDERARGVVVAKGDPLIVIEVDAARNTCRVTRELAS